MANGEKLASEKPHGEGMILGEWLRTLDERYRLSLPTELATAVAGKSGQCILAKESRGCLSLWNSQQWGKWLDDGIELVSGKIRSGRLAGRLDQVQMLGRLLSTRHRTLPVAGRGRIIIPESFRQLLGVEPGGHVLVVGAAVCVEIWQPEQWNEQIEQQMPEFRQLFDQLAD